MATARRRAQSSGERRAGPEVRDVSSDAAGSASALPSSKAPKKRISPTRIQARLDGVRAERAAEEHLLSCGFGILGRNVRVGRYEIDLLACDGPVLIIVEVRARGEGALVRALDSIDARKRSRLRTAAAWLWRDRFSKDPRFDRVRFDCAAVKFDATGRPIVEHVRAAF